MNHFKQYFSSDERIKHNICPVGCLLSKLDDIEFVSYNITSDSCEVGVIAQNVAEIFPTMVKTKSDVIPNIYKESEHSLTSNDSVLIHLTNKLKENTRISIIITKQDIPKYQIYTNVLHVTTETIEVDKWYNYSQTDIVCVYGEMVDDFHVVDSNQIGLLGAACVKELHQCVKCQSDKITQLETSNTLLHIKIDELQQQITNILSRLT